MFCRVCGAEIVDDAVICVKCGRATGVPLAPAPVSAPPPVQEVPAAESGGGALFVTGLIAAFVIPIVGMIIGIVLLVKGKTGHGLGVLFATVLSWGLWCAAMMGG